MLRSRPWVTDFFNSVLLFFFVFTPCYGDSETYAYDENKMHFVTVSDTEHYSLVHAFICSIIKTNQKNLGQIAVFNIGLTESERDTLNSMPYVHVYDIEPVNPSIFREFVVRPTGRTARGWYSWKPVAIKQALDLFPVILYLDASMEVKKSLKLFFKHIRENGYLFINCGHDIKCMTTKPIIRKFSLDGSLNGWILDEWGLEAGFQGLTRAVYHDYVCPIYELAKDIKNFEDDGSAPAGFGAARHDQTLFSIFARLLHYDIKSRYGFELTISGKTYPINFSDYIGFKELKHLKKKKKNSPAGGLLLY